MPKEEKDSQFLSIKSMFLSGSVKRMKDIEKLYPTKMAKALGTNHARYIKKLYKPDEFSIKQIQNLAEIVDINPQMIIDVILKQGTLIQKRKSQL